MGTSRILEPDEADAAGRQSQPAHEHCSGTIPARKSSAHSGVHPPRPDRTPQKTADDATRAYNPAEVAQLLDAAQEVTRSRSEATRETRDAAPTKPPASAGEATRAYSAEEVANLLTKTPGPTPPPPSFTNVELPIHSQKQDLPAPSTLEPTVEESAEAQRQEFLASSPLEPTVETPTDTQRLELAASLSEVVTAAPHDTKRSRSRYRILGLTLACFVAGAAWLVLERSHSAPNPWWQTSAAATVPKSVPVNEAPGLVRLDIEIDPPGATLLLDGEPASNPLRIAYPRSDAVHEIRGEAPGYLARTAHIRFDRNVVVVLALAKALPQAQGTPP